MTTAPFLSRHLGDYLLVAQLSEDALGTVFRALYASDPRRFVRLRLLQSNDLRAEHVRAAIEESAGRVLVHDAVVRQPQLGLVEGIPYHAWDETAGWTLDALLSRVRGLGIRIPPIYALLIAERIASALEHAHRTRINRYPMDHGALWPGFVSLSNDSEVRVGGFGLALAILPAFHGPRLWAEIAPYLAPESRGGSEVGPNSDVYSLGAILSALLSGRRPSAESPLAGLGEEELSSKELGAFLCQSLAPATERYPSAIEMHEALQELLTGPYSLHTPNLALFLYKLLNPESYNVAPMSDWESTNPVVVPGEAEGPKPGPAKPEAGRVATSLILEQSGSEKEGARGGEPLFFAFEQRSARRQIPGWANMIAAGIAGAGLATGLWLALAGSPSETRGPVAAYGPRSAASASTPSLSGLPPRQPVPPVPIVDTALPAPAERRAEMTAPPQPRGVLRHEAAAKFAPKLQQSARRPTRRDSTAGQAVAERARFHAAFARLAADRVEAKELADELYAEAWRNEREGDRLLRGRNYPGADIAFRRAADLYRRAQSQSFDERVCRVKLTAGK